MRGLFPWNSLKEISGSLLLFQHSWNSCQSKGYNLFQLLQNLAWFNALVFSLTRGNYLQMSISSCIPQIHNKLQLFSHLCTYYYKFTFILCLWCSSPSLISVLYSRRTCTDVDLILWLSYIGDCGWSIFYLIWYLLLFSIFWGWNKWESDLEAVKSW